MVFLSELGDKTQITAGLFATQFNPFWVFAGVMLALILLSVMAIFLGNLLMKRLKQKYISIAAGAIFILIGVLTFFGVL